VTETCSSFVDYKNIYDRESNFFAAADTNGDGKLTFAEWRDSSVCSFIKNFKSDEELSKMWAKFDTDDVGYLTKGEAINRKASA
jgi:Ca2+-binding EF-hand superfamily protein